MFMFEKSLIIIIICYGTGFGLLGAQYVLGDVYGITMTSFSGQPIKSALLSGKNPILNINQTAAYEYNITQNNRTTIQTNPVSAAGGIAWELILLLTGTYIFNIMILFGVPYVVVYGMLIIYAALLGRAILAYIRGVSSSEKTTGKVLAFAAKYEEVMNKIMPLGSGRNNALEDS